MIPGTWLKHYVSDARVLPMYFHFVGQLRDGEGERFIIECEWGLRLEVNAQFLSWLEPIGAEESPVILRKRDPAQAVNKKLTGGKSLRPGAEQAMAASASAVRTDDVAARTFPRLFGR